MTSIFSQLDESCFTCSDSEVAKLAATALDSDKSTVNISDSDESATTLDWDESNSDEPATTLVSDESTPATTLYLDEPDSDEPATTLVSDEFPTPFSELDELPILSLTLGVSVTTFLEELATTDDSATAALHES